MLVGFVLGILGMFTHAMTEALGCKGMLIFWLVIFGVITWMALALYLVAS